MACSTWLYGASFTGWYPLSFAFLWLYILSPVHISETLLHCNMNPSSHSLICFLSDSWMPPWSPSPERISRKRLFYLCTSVWPGPVAAFVAPTLHREVEEEETVRNVERDSLRKIREKTSSLFFLNTASLAFRPSLRPSIWPSLIGWLFGSCMNEASWHSTSAIVAGVNAPRPGSASQITYYYY